MVTSFIVNPGSTSRKYALYKNGVCIVRISCESTGDRFTMSVIKNQMQVVHKEMTATDFEKSAMFALSYLVSEDWIHTLADIAVIGVRVVAPGTFFTQHREIDDRYIDALKNIQNIAPLHTPHLIEEIVAIQGALPGVHIIGVSDSNFHTSIPEHIRSVSVPKVDAQKFDIYRFGYHGLSFASISHRLESVFGELPKRTIVCHIGGGVSIAALREGKSVATSMGYSPVSGVLMGSRGGDITAGVVASLTIQKRLTGNNLYEYLYTQCGFKGVAGVSDLRLLLERKATGDADAIRAVDMFIHQIRSWIGAHAVLLGGLDAIVLTATASERNPQLRKMVLSNLTLFNAVMDTEKNESLVGKGGFIHTPESKVKIAVVKTNEMGEIDCILRNHFS